MRDRTEELLDSLVTLGTIAEKERGVCNAFPAFKRFVRYLQAEKKLIRKIAASEAQAVSTLITAALRASPYVRREPGAAEARLRRQLGTLNAGLGCGGGVVVSTAARGRRPSNPLADVNLPAPADLA